MGRGGGARLCWGLWGREGGIGPGKRREGGTKGKAQMSLNTVL